MKLGACSRESDLSDALRTGSWPLTCDASLRAHIEQCEICRATVLLAQLLKQDRSAAMEAMPLGSPGLLWWRAQILQRHAAIRQAAQPVRLAITIALCSSIAVLIITLLGLRSQIADWIASIASVPTSALSDSAWSQTTAALRLGLVVFAITVLATIGGFVVYEALQRE